jgi:vitamin B12 transporter
MGPLRRLRPFSVLFLLAGLSTLVATQPARADVAPPESTAAAANAPRDAAPAAPRYRLQPVVVTAERIPVPLDRVPSDVTVIGRSRLSRDQALFLADELRDVPAVDVERSGSFGKLTDVRLRGADPRHTLVLFDGIPLNGPWAGTFDFADLPGAGWGQVEVMGGPASSLYGSGAVGGVIQFLSPTAADDTRLRAGAEYGERATARQSLEWNAARGAGVVGAYLSRLTSDGTGPRDAYSGVAARVYSLIPVGDDRLRVSGLFTRGAKDIPFDYRFDATDFTTHEVLDPNTDENDRVAAGRVGYAHPFGRRFTVESELSAFAGKIRYRNRPDTAGGDYVDTDLDNQRAIASLRARITAGPVGALLGAEYRAENVTRDDNSLFGGFPSVTNVDRDVHTRSLYAQLHGEWTRLLVDAGVRLDDHSRYGATGVPRVAVGVPITEAGLKLRAGYGRAFTAPTLSDLYYPFYGSETLRPERSRTWEAGADGAWLDGKVEAHATWHTTRFRDLIQSNSFFVADNIGRARIEGEEYRIAVAPLKRLTLGARAARLVAKRVDLAAGSDNRLPKRPRWRAGVSADVRPASGVTLAAGLRWVDSTVDPFDFIDAGGRLLAGDTPGYASLDLGGAVSLARWVPAEARLRVSNALDREYSEVKGYPALGRTIMVGLAYTR